MGSHSIHTLLSETVSRGSKGRGGAATLASLLLSSQQHQARNTPSLLPSRAQVAVVMCPAWWPCSIQLRMLPPNSKVFIQKKLIHRRFVNQRMLNEAREIV